MSELVLAAPLRIEAALIGSAVRGAPILKTGMGPEKARQAASALRDEAGQAVLVVGFCGGLDDEALPGEVIVAEEVCVAADEGHPEEAVRCELAPQLIPRLAGRGLKLRSGRIVCVSRLALGERRAELLAGGAIAVDMESVWLAAGAAGRPFGVVRVVLDSPSHELLRPQAALWAIRAARALRRVSAALEGFAPAA